MSILRGAITALLLACAVQEAGAQVRRPSAPLPGQQQQPQPLARRDTLRAGRDTTLRGDTLSRPDTAAQAKFADPDTVMQRLLALPGYSVTRYQGEDVTFNARTRGLVLETHAMVLRDTTLVKSDTIFYDGTGSTIRVGSVKGAQNIFVAPGNAPLYSAGPATYNLASRRASISQVRTQLDQSGQVLVVSGERGVAVLPRDSTAAGANSATFYLRNGTVTACTDSIPDYYFKAREIKKAGSFVVARPAVLYIGDVPVFWLPFLFQDTRNGRRSGILPPNVGISDFVRNSSSYRRNIEGLGYYFAVSDFLDAQAFVDWRSSAGQGTLGDPGFVRYNGEVRYRWLDRYVTGNLALSETRQDSASNLAVSWGHQEQFTRNSSLTTNFNYVSSTRLQRQTTVNPYSALSTISSQANYQQKVGPAQFSLGGTQKQYPGRNQRDLGFPSVSLSTSPLNLASWLSWTPNLSYGSTKSYNIDQPSALGLLYRAGKTDASQDTVFTDTLPRNAYASTFSFDSPIRIFGYDFGNRFTLNSARNDFPERAIVADVSTGVQSERIYTSTFHTDVDWTPSFTLPPLARNNLNLTPTVSLQNREGGSFMVRNERTGGRWVRQKKRLTYGLSASPTLFGLFGGFGPFARLRHSVTPIVGYTYAPGFEPDTAFLAALGRTRVGYLGNLAQNALSFQLSTNVEAKLRSRNDSNPEAGDKLKLLSVNFTGLSYDINRLSYAREHHNNEWWRGLTTETFGYTLRSDLLPGMDIGVDYSLFEGSTISDTARFSPYRQRVTGSFSFSNTANPFAVFARLFGRAVPASDANTDRLNAPADERYARQIASQPVAGRGARTAAFLPSAAEGWQASFTFTSARQRPPTPGSRNVVAYDPAARCTQFDTPLLRLAYDNCVANARTNPSPETPITSSVIGAPIYLTPPTTSLGSNLGFNITEHWAATWNTQYDFVQKNFASQIVSLQRDLHDWRAIFAFTQSPNGSFAFNFLISLKAEPALKFDYHKATYHNEGLGSALAR